MSQAIYVNLLGLSAIAAKLLGWGVSAWNDGSREFRCVRVWLGILATEDILLFWALRHLGLRSFWYARVYYGADLFSNVCGLFVILRLAELAFQESRQILPLLRRGAILAVIGIIVMSSTGVVAHWRISDASRSHFLMFAEELEQNMNVAGMLASIVLWGTINALAIPGTRLRRIAAAIGASYSAGSLSWAFYSLFGHYRVVATALSVISTVSIFLIGWTLAFEKEATANAGEFTATKPLSTSAASGWAGGR